MTRTEATLGFIALVLAAVALGILLTSACGQGEYWDGLRCYPVLLPDTR